jgi:hypothetical protein
MGAISKLAVKAAKAALKDAPYFAPGSPERAANLARYMSTNKLLAPDGSLITGYHGTAGDFTAFDPTLTGTSGIPRTGRSKVIFFSGDPEDADAYAKMARASNYQLDKNSPNLHKVIPAYLRMENPLFEDIKGRVTTNRDTVRRLLKVAKEKGNDGLVLKNTRSFSPYDTPADHYAVFDPRQIKSIFNRGTFDLNDPDILKARGGRISSFKVKR